jgi:hypothetical protein
VWAFRKCWMIMSALFGRRYNGTGFETKRCGCSATFSVSNTFGAKLMKETATRERERERERERKENEQCL